VVPFPTCAPGQQPHVCVATCHSQAVLLRVPVAAVASSARLGGLIVVGAPCTLQVCEPEPADRYAAAGLGQLEGAICDVRALPAGAKHPCARDRGAMHRTAWSTPRGGLELTGWPNEASAPHQSWQLCIQRDRRPMEALGTRIYNVHRNKRNVTRAWVPGVQHLVTGSGVGA
jgi:hypothetical protein